MSDQVLITYAGYVVRSKGVGEMQTKVLKRRLTLLGKLQNGVRTFFFYVYLSQSHSGDEHVTYIHFTMKNHPTMHSISSRMYHTAPFGNATFLVSFNL